MAQDIKRYGTNCISIGSKVYSYETHVANISDTSVVENGYYSQTTSRHVKSVANELGLNIVKYK